MGCDIHAAVEYQRRKPTDPSGEWWVHVMDAGFLPRYYRMFGALVDGHSRWPSGEEGVAGVAPERGLPPIPSDISKDVEWSQQYQGEHYVGNAVCYADHTFSWLTPAEYREALARCGDADPEWLALGAYMDFLERYGAVRLVFGFDS